MEEKYIPLEDCKDRVLYKVRARNYNYAVFNKVRKSFIGLRESTYLELEYHYDTGAPNGTVEPIKELENLPEDIYLGEKYPAVFDDASDREIEYKKTDKHGWYFVDTGEYCGDKTRIHGVSNRKLAAWLKEAVIRHENNKEKILKVVYDPKNGTTVPDNRIKQYVQNRIKLAKECNLTVIVGNDILVHAFRLAVLQQQIDCDKIVFEFEGQPVKVCSCGALAKCPDVLKTYSNIMIDILKAKVKVGTCKKICEK